MTDTDLSGTYSATWMAQGFNPNGPYTQQATLAVFRFNKDSFHGLIHLYRGGAPEHQTIPVKGEYLLLRNERLEVIDGFMYVGLLPGAVEPPPMSLADLAFHEPVRPFQIQKLYVVRRKKEEFDFLLVQSIPVVQPKKQKKRGRDDGEADPDRPHPGLPTTPNGIVQGTFKRCDSF